MSSKKFKFLPDIATADLAFEAYGVTYNELFENAGLALTDAMVKLNSVEGDVKREIKKEEKSVENLLFSFLEELIFLKDAQLLVFSKIKCEVQRLRAPSHPERSPAKLGEVEGSHWKIKAKIIGEKIDSEKHKLGVDVKAVTKHLFKIEKLPDKTLRAQIILDV